MEWLTETRRVSTSRNSGAASHAPVHLADRLAGYLVYFALAAAAITFIITVNARSPLSVMIVAGSCDIAAGTPLAIPSSMRARRISRWRPFRF